MDRTWEGGFLGLDQSKSRWVNIYGFNDPCFISFSEAFQNEEVHLLVCEIPVKTSGEGPATIISLDGANVNSDIYMFLEHSFGELQCCHPDFLQPSGGNLAKLDPRQSVTADAQTDERAASRNRGVQVI
ncbi:uncharacterized protein BJ212DRAFT_1302293 [Suillus subaureus]|uniref:Uncharacterized protein n=1 Tax=Suillus subaureus TaxID=48587 RepID=A0A9P7JA64_9AGAM|nr:uncharacterized protein BJ212DRAFT_1302293 [Suillus subaureus]KAG1810535.1 hypothetical protein BJ212DRAFT_1302293 [Suillus subaureus]